MRVIKKAQISVEYLIVVGFIVTVVIGILGIALYYTSGVRDQIKDSQLRTFASKVVSNAEVVFYRGEPSRTTITAYLPEGVSAVYVYEDGDEYQLVFEISMHGAENVVAYSSNVPIEIITPPGISENEGVKRLLLEAKDDKVEITQQ